MKSISIVFLLFFNEVLTVEVPVINLNDGNKIPILALGTYGLAQDIARMRQTISWAVAAGYRHIDTASLYGNEVEIGQGIADVIKNGLVKREELFVTTKDDGNLSDIDYLETWKGMEDAKRLGLTRSIGVSNFNTEQIDRVIANSNVKPAVNEIEVNPSLTQERLVANCQNRGIAVMAYSPFGFLVSRDRPNAPAPQADDPTLVRIAQKYGKTTSQVVLRYLIDRGMIPIPKSTNKDRLKQNIDVFNFSLTRDEIDTINKFNSNTRVVDVGGWRDHPYYPFNKD